MTALTTAARVLGWSSIAIGGLQMIGGSRTEAGMQGVGPTVDSHVRFMGGVFVGYGVACLDAAARDDETRMRLFAAAMGAGGLSRLLTRATMGRPHRFHDVLMSMELATPILVEGIRAASAPRRRR